MTEGIDQKAVPGPRLWDWVKSRRNVIAYVALTVAVVVSQWRTEDVAQGSAQLSKANRIAIDQANADRAAARIINCEQKHNTAMAVAKVTAFLDGLIQTAVHATPARTQTEAEKAAAAQFLAASNAGVAEIYATLAKGDCDPSTTTPTVTIPSTTTP